MLFLFSFNNHTTTGDTISWIYEYDSKLKSVQMVSGFGLFVFFQPTNLEFGKFTYKKLIPYKSLVLYWKILLKLNFELVICDARRVIL